MNRSPLRKGQIIVDNVVMDPFRLPGQRTLTMI